MGAFMKIRSSLLCAAVFGFVVFVAPCAAHAAISGQPCPKLGKVATSDDQQSKVACLYNDADALVWTDLSAQSKQASSIVGDKVAATQPTASRSQQRWQGWYVGVNAGIADTTSSDYVSYYAKHYDTRPFGGTAGLGGIMSLKTMAFFTVAKRMSITWEIRGRHLKRQPVIL